MKKGKQYKLTKVLIWELKHLINEGNEIYAKPVGRGRFLFTYKPQEGYHKIEYADNDYIKFILRKLNSLYNKSIKK
jgi:hypothetical protein